MDVHKPNRWPRRPIPTLLDIAAEVLVDDPAASLAEVAKAAGIGRTTLHKQYATRDDLIRAVAHRALDVWAQAVATVNIDEPDGGLRALVTALVPLGPQLEFLWRTPALEHIEEICVRLDVLQERQIAVLRHAAKLGILAADTPDWWHLRVLYAVVYSAAEAIYNGTLAPLDAPDLAFDTLLRGVGARALPAQKTPGAPDE
jgi:AcrR family transcriptional regulator